MKAKALTGVIEGCRAVTKEQVKAMHAPAVACSDDGGSAVLEGHLGGGSARSGAEELGRALSLATRWRLGGKNIVLQYDCAK